MRGTRSIPVAVAAILVTLLSAPAAQADSSVVWDPWGDGRSFGDPAPRHSADLRRAALRHNDDEIVVRARFRGPFVWRIDFRFDTNVQDGTNYVASWGQDAAGEQPRRIEVYRRRHFDDGNARPLCRPRIRFIDRHRVAVFRIPRACLRDPNRIRMYVDNFDTDQSSRVDKTGWTSFVSRG